MSKLNPEATNAMRRDASTTKQRFQTMYTENNVGEQSDYFNPLYMRRGQECEFSPARMKFNERLV